MFEHHKQSLLPFPDFLFRVLKSIGVAVGFVLISLTVGAIGYHYSEDLPWLDATLNASMILTGMGPVNQLRTEAGKFFAIFYSLFSGVAFLSIAAALLAPIIHRFLHKFHIKERE